MAGDNDFFWKKADLPAGFDVGSDGLFFIDDKGKDIKISNQPLIIDGFTKTASGTNWMVIVIFITLDGKVKNLSIGLDEILERNTINKLRSEGYHIDYGKEKLFLAYISEMIALNRVQRSTTYSNTGWFQDDQQLFGTPSEVIGKDIDENYVYVPDNHSINQAERMKPKGTLKAWKANIFNLCQGNKYLLFAIFVSFSSVLLRILKTETGGFHFFGPSSRGKTTLLQVVASVWGYGASPANATSSSFIQTWRTTSNALEAIAASYNDLSLPLDELGQCNEHNFHSVIYDLAGGEGKARMNRSASLIQRHRWCLNVVSTGEISIREKLIANDRKTIKAGQLLRFLDIPVNNDIVMDSHGMNPADYINTLKNACSTYYGTAGKEFILKLIADIKENENTLNQIHVNYEYFKEKIHTAEMPPETVRVANRFALVMLAGDLANEYLDLQLSEDEIVEAVKCVFDAWAAENVSLSDVDRAIEAIKETIENNAGLFASNFDDPKANKKGFRLDDGDLDLYLFTSAQFRDIICGANAAAVAKKLNELGFLHTNNSENGRVKLQARLKINRAEKQNSYYAVKADILGPPEPTVLRKHKNIPDDEPLMHYPLDDDQPVMPKRKIIARKAEKEPSSQPIMFHKKDPEFKIIRRVKEEPSQASKPLSNEKGSSKPPETPAVRHKIKSLAERKKDFELCEYQPPPGRRSVMQAYNDSLKRLAKNNKDN